MPWTFYDVDKEGRDAKMPTWDEFQEHVAGSIKLAGRVIDLQKQVNDLAQKVTDLDSNTGRHIDHHHYHTYDTQGEL